MKKLLLFTIIVFYSVEFLCAQITQTILDESKVTLSGFNLYVTDEYFITLGIYSEKCYVFSRKDGTFIREINPIHTYPGFNWRPLNIGILEKELFFTNSAPFGLYISHENDNVKPLPRDFLAPTAFKFINDSTFVGILTNRNGEHTINLFNKMGGVINKFDSVDFFHKYMMYRIENLTFHYFDDYIYLVNPFEDYLYKFTISGELIEIINVEIPKFSKVRRDINPSTPPQQAIGEMIRAQRENSFIYNAFSLENSRLLLVVVDKSVNVRLVTYSITDRKILSITTENKYPAYAYENSIYFVDHRDDAVVINEYEIK